MLTVSSVHLSPSVNHPLPSTHHPWDELMGIGNFHLALRTKIRPWLSGEDSTWLICKKTLSFIGLSRSVIKKYGCVMWYVNSHESLRLCVRCICTTWCIEYWILQSNVARGRRNTGSNARYQYSAESGLMLNTDICLLKNIKPDKYGKWVSCRLSPLLGESCSTN